MLNIRMIVFGLLLAVAACKSDSRVEERASPEKSGVQIPKVKISQIEEGIKTYIKKQTEKGDGFFHVHDKDKELRMKLVRVHTEYLSNLGPKRNFACVDLADVSGDVYDVDFFLSGDPGEMEVTETTVHKLNGKPFYTWKQQEDKTWNRVPVEGASAELLGVIEGEDQFEFRYQAELPEITNEAKMWIPIARSDSFQTVKLISLNVPGKQQVLEEKEFNNSILYLELGPEHSRSTIDITYAVIRKEKGPFKDAETKTEKYLAANLLMPVGGRFKDIADEAIGGKRDDSKLVQARALYDYIIDNMRYMKHGNYGHGDAVYACDTRTGNCTEFHSFFISLARSVGIPARFSIGVSIPSDRNEGGIDGYHCWAEFYAEGKWWPVDISEGNKYTALATYYFGRHPANRIELNRGRDLKVQPGPLSGPINFLAYPLLEIAGEPTLTKTTFSFVRKKDLSHKSVLSFLKK
ncbi:MAG: transglutaminase domain-containing protein [Cyclobacteriaceae bacterium]